MDCLHRRDKKCAKMLVWHERLGKLVPPGLCEHGRRRYCKECGGSQICEHGRRRSGCKECGGSQICEHELQTSKVLLCDLPPEVLCAVVNFMQLRELIAAMAVCCAFRNYARLCIAKARPSFEPLFESPFKLTGFELLNINKIDLAHQQIGNDVVKAFSTAIAIGSLGTLKHLDVAYNHISDVGMDAFAEALKPNTKFSMGALGELKNLALNSNKIGDAGMISFSDAIARGALANLKELWLNRNQFGDEGMKAFSKAIGSGSLSSLKELVLSSNSIGDVGMKAFSEAIASESLGSLTNLFLYNNQIGDEGMKAFSTAIASGSLPKLAYVDVCRNPGNNMGVQEACSARGRIVAITKHS